MVKKVFFSDEKNSYLNPPVIRQNDCVWSRGKKRHIDEHRLVVERSKFAKHVMVSAGVCAVVRRGWASSQKRLT